MKPLLLLLLVGCLVLTLSGQAQVAPGVPSGGYPLREVRQLRRVPAPPGGLLPFRRGRLWGFVDTSGRVVIEPVLLGTPGDFSGGFVFLDLGKVPQFVKRRHRAAAQASADPVGYLKQASRSLPRRYQQQSALLNARGEMLLIGEGQEPLLQADSSLRAGRLRRRVQPPRYWSSKGWQSAPGRQTRRVYRQGHGSVEMPRYRQDSLGYGRYARRRNYETRLILRYFPNEWADLQYLFWAQVPPTVRGAALVDERGRRLTGYNYARIGQFSDNRARTELMSKKYRQPLGRRRLLRPGLPLPAVGPVFLDRLGRELVLPAQVAQASWFEDGAAVVWTARAGRSQGGPVRRQGAIIDTLGRLLLPFVDSLSRPDEAGLLRLMRADSAGLTRFLTRRGRPAFAHQPFRRAGAFHHGRAWVETVDGRQGLINLRGQWVTPLHYEELGTPYQRYQSGMTDTTRISYFPPRPPSADTAYMRCRRAGKYGWLARHSGHEVIPARYDSIVYDLTEGLACAYRGGQPYLINARGRELARGEYRGSRYAYPGGPVQLYRPQEGTWSVVDTLGRARLPWLPGSGFLSPEGRAVLRPRPGSPAVAVVDSAGRVLIPAAEGVGYSGTPPGLTRLRQVLDEPQPLISTRYEVTLRPSQVYRQPLPGGGVQLLRARDLQPLTPGAFANLHVLGSGWHVGRRQADSLSVLIDPAGRQYAAPPGTSWYAEAHFDYLGKDFVPFVDGSEQVTFDGVASGATDRAWLGRMTRGGRPLWDEPAPLLPR